MDPTVAQMFAASFGLSVKNQADDITLAIARQRDATQLDNRLLTGVLMNELFTGSDPSKMMDYNTASHVPLPQPWVITPNPNVPKA